MKKIIDAHMHLPYRVEGLQNKKEHLMIQLEKCGITYGIVISDSSLESSIGSLTECVELFGDTDRVFVVGGISPLIAYANQLKILEKYIVEKKIVAVKLFCGHEKFYLNDNRLLPLYEMAASYRIPILFHSGWENAEYAEPDIVLEVSKQYPNINFICCHVNYPKVTECVQQLRDCRNVYFDLSSIADNCSIAMEFHELLSQQIREMPERFLFGSDYGGCDIKEHVDFIDKLDISVIEKEMVFYNNAKRLYRLDVMEDL